MYEEMSLGQWVGTIILSMIPCVGLILLIIWAVSSQNETKKRWAQAMLIVQVILIVITILFYVLFGAAMLAAYSATSAF